MSALYLNQFQKLLEVEYQCHTVILYGSRSRGTDTPESDFDLIGFSDSKKDQRIAQVIDGQYLDAFVYGTDSLNGNEVNFLRIKDGIVLVERDTLGSELLKRIEDLYLKGPKTLSSEEIELQVVWVKKMLGRIKKQDLEGNFRRVWLQHDLLEMYFSLRGRWYLGPKEGFAWLAAKDLQTLELFETSLQSPTCIENLNLLSQRVLLL